MGRKILLSLQLEFQRNLQKIVLYEGQNIKSGFHATCFKIYGGRVGRKRREERETETERTGVSVLVGLLINHQEHMVLNLYIFGTDLNPLALTLSNPTVPIAILPRFLVDTTVGRASKQLGTR